MEASENLDRIDQLQKIAEHDSLSDYFRVAMLNLRQTLAIINTNSSGQDIRL